MVVAEVMRRTWAMTWKDVRVELRARERMNAMLFFAALVLFIFNFALGPDLSKLREAAPGLLWLAFLFTGMLGLGRSFQAERENECFEELLLTPGDRESLYFGKLAGNILFMVMAEALILPLFAILYNLEIWPLPACLVAFLDGGVLDHRHAARRHDGASRSARVCCRCCFSRSPSQ
jgi:heme exporter protein B